MKVLLMTHSSAGNKLDCSNTNVVRLMVILLIKSTTDYYCLEGKNKTVAKEHSLINDRPLHFRRDRAPDG